MSIFYKKRGKRAKGQYFEIDALIAIGILIVGLIYVKNLSVQQPSFEANKEYSDEAVKLLSQLKVGDLDNDLLQIMEKSNLREFTSRNYTVAKQIAIYMFKNNRTLAENVTRSVLDGLIPSDQEYSVVVSSNNGSDVIEHLVYNTSEHGNSPNVFVSNSMITGLQETKPIIGKLARLYLENVRSSLREYIFIGGFIGQGNITYQVNLPEDISVYGVYFEGFVGEEANFSVNDHSCGRIKKTRNKAKLNITSTMLPDCAEFFEEGPNNVSFGFLTEDKTEHYIGGGFVEISYYQERYKYVRNDTRRVHLPEIKGIPSIFDSIFIDGNITDVNARIKLDKKDNEEMIFSFGNETILRMKDPGEYDVELDKRNFTGFERYNNSNVPFRLGYPAEKNGTANVVWITDRSDSMGDCGETRYDYDSDEKGCGFYESFTDVDSDKLREWKLYDLDTRLYIDPDTIKDDWSSDAADGLCFDMHIKNNIQMAKVFPEEYIENTQTFSYKVNWSDGGTYLDFWLFNLNSDFVGIHLGPNKLDIYYDISAFTSKIYDESYAFSSNETDVELRYYDNKFEIYMNDQLIVTNSRLLGTHFMVIKSDTEFCIKDYKKYDENTAPAAPFAYGNYHNQSVPGRYYEKIGPEEVFYSSTSKSSSCGSADLCVCDVGTESKWENEIWCYEGDANYQAQPKYQDCCNDKDGSGGYCEALLGQFGATEYRRTQSNSVKGNLEQCTEDEIDTWYPLGDYRFCITLCDDWSSENIGDCGLVTDLYNCTYFSKGDDTPHNYCFNSAELGDKRGKMCYDYLKTEDIDKASFDTNCVNLPFSSFPIPSENEGGDRSYTYEVCSGGSCLHQYTDSCNIIYTLSDEEWKDSCDPADLFCFCALNTGENAPCHTYDVSYTRKVYNYGTCLATHDQHYYYRIDYKESSDVSNCYGKVGNDYECRNFWTDGLIGSEVYDARDYTYPSKPYSYPYANTVPYSAAFFETEFSYTGSPSSLKMNVSKTKDSVLCYLNGNLIYYTISKYDSDSTSLQRVAEINANLIEEGTNKLSCEWKGANVGDSSTEIRVKLYTDSETLVDYDDNDWTYELVDSYCGWGTDIYNASCEYGEKVDSCQGKLPLLNEKLDGNNLQIAYHLYNKDRIDTSALDSVVHALSNIIGGNPVIKTEGNMTPSSFWDSADILILDIATTDTVEAAAWADMYSDEITAALKNGKIIITPDSFAAATGAIKDDAHLTKSFGFSSYTQDIDSGTVVSLGQNIVSAAYYADSVRAGVPSGFTDYTNDSWHINYAAHIFSSMYNVWDRGDSGLTCGVNKFCIPPYEPHCEVCEYTKMERTKEISKKYLDTIASIPGNNISLIGYGTNLTCNPQIFNMTGNSTLLQQTIDQYYADCGTTCISCTLAQSMDTLNSTLGNLPEEIADGLIYWSDMEVVDVNGKLIDLSGNDYTSTISGAVKKSSGIVGNAQEFNASGGSISLPFGTGTNFHEKNYTFSMWVKPLKKKLNKEQVVFGSIQSPSMDPIDMDPNNFIIDIVDTGKEVWDLTIAGETLMGTNKEVEFDKWVHIVVVTNSTHAILYFDGVKFKVIDISVAANLGKNFEIGRTDLDSSRDFNGTIDEVMVWDRALSAAEINELYFLDGVNEHGENFVVLMSDGEANYAWDPISKKSYRDEAYAPSQAVEYAERLCNERKASLLAVSFGRSGGADTLKEMARVNNESGCGGEFYEARNDDELDKAFGEVTKKILFALQVTNKTMTEDNILYKDSYLEYKVEPNLPVELNNTIRFQSRTRPLGKECKDINVDLRGFEFIDELYATIYSGDYWTNMLMIDGQKMFLLEDFGNDFKKLGDPFVVGINKSWLHNNDQDFTLDIGLGGFPNNFEQICSPFNRLLYTAYLPKSYANYEIHEFADGCIWNVTMEGGWNVTMTVPVDYTGDRHCSVDNYNNSNALDLVFLHLLNILDVNDDDKVDISFEEEDLNIDVETIEQIPYLWGPALIRVEVWKS